MCTHIYPSLNGYNYAAQELHQTQKLTKHRVV